MGRTKRRPASPRSTASSGGRLAHGVAATTGCVRLYDVADASRGLAWVKPERLGCRGGRV